MSCGAKPLPDIAMHIVATPRVGLLLTHEVRKQHFFCKSGFSEIGDLRASLANWHFRNKH